MDHEQALDEIRYRIQELKEALVEAEDERAELAADAYEDGWSLRDIGEALEVSHTAVRKWFQRSQEMQEIREALSGLPGFPS